MRVLRLREVMHLTGLSRSTIYVYMNNERFPKSINLGARSVGWIEHEIEEWIEDKVRLRSGQSLSLN